MKLRIDGRRNLETRNFEAKIGNFDSDGSCELRLGNTIVLCIINGPKDGTGIKVIYKDKLVSQLITSLFQDVVFAKSEIEIHLQVLQTDGGLLHALINCTTLALIDAGIPMCDYVSACSCDAEKIDLNQYEENNNPVLTVGIMRKSNKISLINLDPKLHLDQLEHCLPMVKDGCIEIGELMHQSILKLS